ncbi:MAG: NAD(P)-dependent oxidoreductase [Burkholderiales bacterium]|nr:NAD(P)-dependent oxidoreductase [Burkholderiales bacterium]
MGIIGFGQLGSSLASVLRQTGVHAVIVYSVPADAVARERAERSGLQWSETPAGLAKAKVVFSAVTATTALDAARNCAQHLAADAMYVDLNSMGPRQKRAVADLVTGAGCRFVDGAVLGAAVDGIRMPIICSGPEAVACADLLSTLGMNVRAVGDQAGDASAIKIVRSVLAKGLETLYVEALLAAGRLGVRDEVLETFCSWLDMRPAAATAELLVTTHVVHAERRMHELEMSIDAVQEAGVAPIVTKAVHERLAATTRSGVGDQFGGNVPQSLAKALDALQSVL